MVNINSRKDTFLNKIFLKHREIRRKTIPIKKTISRKLNTYILGDINKRKTDNGKTRIKLIKNIPINMKNNNKPILTFFLSIIFYYKDMPTKHLNIAKHYYRHKDSFCEWVRVFIWASLLNAFERLL